MNGQPNSRYELFPIERLIKKTKQIEPPHESTKETLKEADVTIPKVIPQQIPDNYKKYTEYYFPVRKKNYHLLLTFIIAFLSIFLVYINVFPDFFSIIALLSSILVIVGFIAIFKRKQKVLIPTPKYQPPESQKPRQYIPAVTPKKFPHEMFLRKDLVDEMSRSNLSQAQMNTFHTYERADRPTASLQQTQFSFTDESNFDQLASDSLKRIHITTSQINKDLMNFKAFLQKRLLKKLIPKLHQNDPIIEEMINVPNYEHQKDYIIDRIKKLEQSEYIAAHNGDKGQRWYDREWTNEFPSDNQIMMHILSVWLSDKMGGLKESKYFRNYFKERYFYVGMHPFHDSEDSIMICTQDWSKFYVWTKLQNSDTFEKFWAYPGRNSMYYALTLFFYFVKEKRRFILDGCDLKEAPFFLDRVYSNERFV